MASVGQAIKNILKYGPDAAIRGAIATPGGYLGGPEPSAPSGSTIPVYGSDNYANTIPIDTTSNGVPYGPELPLTTPAPAASTPQDQTATTSAQKFTPTYYNGTLYTDPNALAQAQLANAPRGSNPSFSTVYNGKTYTNPHEYYQSLISDALASHNQAVSAADKAYKQGLITFAQRQQAIDLSRSNQLANTAGYFSSISPYAYQSAQGTQEKQINDAYGQDVGNLNQDKQNFTDTYNQNLATEGQNFQGLKDRYTNAENQAVDKQNAAAGSNARSLQSYIDQVKNNLLLYTNQLDAAQKATSAGTTAGGAAGTTTGGGGMTAGSPLAAAPLATMLQPAAGVTPYMYGQFSNTYNPQQAAGVR